jgi:hypothetical protein
VLKKGIANLRRVPFAKRKSRRGPLQRLSDQRRSLALAGLAVGAVASAAVLRRRRRGEEPRLEAGAAVSFPPEEPAAAAQPEAEVAATPVDAGPPPALEVPPAASEPELEEAPINAPAPSAADDAAPTPSSDDAAPAPSAADDVPASETPAEPTTGELSAEEASILAVLAQSGRADEDRTAIAVATSLERETADVAGVLRKLGAEGVVSGELYTAAGDKIWAVTERGVRRLGAQS